MKTHIENINIDVLRHMTQEDRTYGYSEFCKLLNIPHLSSGSNSQIKQLNELSMICEYEKVNTKYNFIRMREENEIFLYQERSQYTPLIEYALTEKFLEANLKHGEILFASMRQLMLWCGITHENYDYMRTGKMERRIGVIHKYDYNPKELNTFLSVSYEHVLKPMVRSAIRTMDNKASITVHKGYRLYKNLDDGTIRYVNVIASDNIGQDLDAIVADTYTEFHIKKVQDLFFAKKSIQNDFYKACDAKCKEQLGYDGFYNCYAIAVHKKRSRYNLKRLFGELNDRVQKKILASKALSELPTSSKEEFVDKMIRLDTDANFKRDVEEYYRMKFGV